MDPVASLVNANWVDIKTDTYSLLQVTNILHLVAFLLQSRFKQEKTAEFNKSPIVPNFVL